MLDKKVEYKKLNTRQKEIYNFQKASAIFAEYGWQTIKLSDDWNSADFLAIKFGSNEFLKVQLKGGLTFQKNYLGKDLQICFFDRVEGEVKGFYIYPHDTVLKEFPNIKRTRSWKIDDRYVQSQLSKPSENKLRPYKISM